MKQNSHKKTVEKTCLECRLAFRLSAKEKQEIEAKAKLCAMSPSRTHPQAPSYGTRD